MPKKPDLSCATCGKPMWKVKGSLPQGQATCLDCRRQRNPKPEPAPTHWLCQVCGVRVERSSGPIGKYCAQHKHTRGKRRPHLRQITCKTCGRVTTRSSGSTYCTPECRPQRRAPRTNLQWRQCGHCERWICRPGRKYCNGYCAREAMMTQQGCRNRTCKQCQAALGYLSTNTLCDECRRSNLRQRRQRDRRNPNRTALNNHRQRARHYGVDYEPVQRSKVYDRDGWRCGICRKHVDKRLKYPHPMSASLDHIVPMALGGGHTYINTQLAHFICNSTKCSWGTGDQLALIG